MPTPVLWTAGGRMVPWQRKRLRELRCDEAFFETRLAEAPSQLLELDPFTFPPPLVALRQAGFRTPQGRDVRPDVLVLAPNGQVALVEVKLHDNPELKDRRAIAQVLDYAAALSTCAEEELLEACSSAIGGLESDSWERLVQQLFRRAAEAQKRPLPTQDWAGLAQRIVDNARAGQIHLVIACDEAPEGLRELVQALCRQATLHDFRLHVAEVAPFVPPGAESADELLLIPAIPLRTEVVGRVVVTVNSAAAQDEASAPSVSVETTPLEEMEERLEATRHDSRRFKWTQAGFEEQLRGRAAPACLPATERLYAFLKDHAVRFTLGTGAVPSFNPRLPGFGQRSVLTLYANGNLSLNYQYISGSPEVETRRDVLMSALQPVFGGTPQPNEFPVYKQEVWAPRVDALIAALKASMQVEAAA